MSLLSLEEHGGISEMVKDRTNLSSCLSHTSFKKAKKKIKKNITIEKSVKTQLVLRTRSVVPLEMIYKAALLGDQAPPLMAAPFPPTPFPGPFCTAPMPPCPHRGWVHQAQGTVLSSASGTHIWPGTLGSLWPCSPAVFTPAQRRNLPHSALPGRLQPCL